MVQKNKRRNAMNAKNVICGLVLFSFMLAKAEVNGLAQVESKKVLSSIQLKAAQFLYQKANLQSSKKEESSKVSQLSIQQVICDQPTHVSVECIRFVSGSYPTADDKIRAARSCSGVQKLECVTYVSGNYPSMSDRESSASSCSGVTDVGCVQFVSGSYPSLSDRIEAAASCKYSSLDCVKQVVGSYPTLAERVAAAKACGGQ